MNFFNNNEFSCEHKSSFYWFSISHSIPFVNFVNSKAIPSYFNQAALMQTQKAENVCELRHDTIVLTSSM